MGYALFAARKQVVDAQINSTQLQMTQRQDEQFYLATQQTGLKQQLSSLTAAQSGDLADLYGKLSEVDNTTQREQINAEIKQREQEFKQETDDINRAIYEVAMKEQAVEMEVKRLETVVTTLTKQLDNLEQAEGPGIDRATPKFGGVG